MKIKLSQVVTYLFLLFVILNTNSVYLWEINANFYLSELAVVFEILLFFCLSGKSKISKRITTAVLKSLFLYFLIAIIYFVMKVDSSQFVGYIMRFILFIPLAVLLFTLYFPQNLDNKLLLRFSNLVVAFAVVSLVFWLLGTNLGILKPTNEISVRWASGRTLVNTYKSYFGLYFEWQKIDISGIVVYRNCSVFSEAPMYAIVLVIALLCELFIRQKLDRTKIIILSLAIFSTLTTMGILCMLIAFFFKYYESAIHGKKINWKTFLLPAVVLVVILVSLYLIQQKQETSSWINRVNSWAASWRVFMSNPLSGDGYLNTSRVVALTTDIYGNTSGTSNSFALILAQGGLMLGYIYFYPIIKSIIKSLRKKQFNISYFGIIFFIIFAFTMTQSAYLILMIIAFLMMTTINLHNERS